ncbi:hypothetical protein SmJEL517_g05756 [Synchytrium microbalum]|uniref:CUE domain-containing protein n=1 Tax=Synchytrium microbalum TaxID=1806994 RepID=A0A507BZM4_9FUNG|nr:uncharacterized protein SmJEL517_g05756 [Synchytrium microbalum]TPX30723.1 hypothetical protein SmJEL517_g05756 [Synchytrium microbalum]
MEIVTVVLIAVVIIFLISLFSNSSSAPIRPASSIRTAPPGRPYTGRRHPVDENQLNVLASMFEGQLPREAISEDLSRTGSADVTIENILAGRVEAPTPAAASSANVRAPVGGSSVRIADLVKEPPPTTPVKAEWSSTPKDRESNLRSRKAQMLYEARQ